MVSYTTPRLEVQDGPSARAWNTCDRTLVGLGFTGSYQQVQRLLKPYRAQRKWSE